MPASIGTVPVIDGRLRTAECRDLVPPAEVLADAVADRARRVPEHFLEHRHVVDEQHRLVAGRRAAA